MTETVNKKELMEKLEMFVPVVARVHGPTHPEFYEVQKEFENIKNQDSLDQAFKNLREITDNYKVPSDVCESYEAVYSMLEQLDKGR
ncbi:MAG: iron-sulfur cluster repair di-iron protein, ric [Erysipelothrix sp.]|nr:iron-sulfur cluster repair di-iron protein, ric [Erysipelothrix sp.]